MTLCDQIVTQNVFCVLCIELFTEANLFAMMLSAIAQIIAEQGWLYFCDLSFNVIDASLFRCLTQIGVDVLTFDDRQMSAFRSIPLAAFAAKMQVHLHRFFPDHCKALGAGGVEEAIKHGIGRAKFYEIVSQRDVCIYIDLMFAFGRDFDTDSKLPWVADILNTAGSYSPRKRINRLHKRALFELARAGG